MERNNTTILFAFDCDHTLVDRDSDISVAELGDPLPHHVTSLCDGHFWTDYMNAVFRYLHEQGIDLATIGGRISSLPLVKGMSQVINSLLQQHAQIVIISDANDFGISRILTKLIGDEEKASAISLLTNTSYTTDSGCLQISPFHSQREECHFCPPNLCKGNALISFIKEHGPFHHIVYVGDGKNDICPSTRLTKNDIIFAREGFDLQRIILSGEKNGKKVEVEANVKFWNDGFDILNHILST